MKVRKEIIDRKRNDNFAAALDHLKRQGIVSSQVELAKLIGVSKDTITNILHYYTPVTEDVITKLQTATNNMFNLQWLRGISDVMLSQEATQASHSKATPSADGLDMSSVINTIVAAKDCEIAALQREMATKDKLIASMERELALLRAQQSAERKPENTYPDDYPYPIGVADPNR